MTKPFIIILLLLVLTCNAKLAANTHQYKLPDLRKEFLQASRNQETGERFYDKMSSYKKNDPIVLAYKAISEAIMAKYAWNPYAKIKHLKTAASIFENAVALNDQHPEIRFLRFTMEHYVPRYLNMSEHVEQDKDIVISSLKQHPASGMPTVLARGIRDFMLTKDHCNAKERQELQAITF